MGLFDFFKPKDQDKMQEILQGIHKEIFPGGQEQVEKEVQDVRSLLDFKYTKEEIKNTYFHAAAIFYMNKLKQQDNIVTSILSNKNSVVTKQDAIKIFEYLKKKFGITPLQSVVSETIGGMSKANALLLITKGGIVELKRNYKDISDFGKFEVILLNSAIALQAFQQANPSTYKSTEQDYIRILVSVAQTYQINIPQTQLMQLIESRITLYSNEVYQLFNSTQYKAYKSFNSIYNSPLSENPISTNKSSEAEYELYKLALVKMLAWVLDKTTKIS
ncbi:MAG TPA: hypothetical protein PK110_14865 [Niabella sp.]|nr:hypothetical protein [Niabella sp.]